MSSSSTAAGSGAGAGLGEERGEGLCAGGCPRRDPALQGRDGVGRGQAVGKLRLVDQQARAAILEHVGDLGRLLRGRERHRHGPEARQGEMGEDERRAVAEQQRHPVAGLDAAPRQRAREAPGRRLDLGPGQALRRRRPAPRRPGCGRRPRRRGRGRSGGRSTKQGTTRSPKCASWRRARSARPGHGAYSAACRRASARRRPSAPPWCCGCRPPS